MEDDPYFYVDFTSPSSVPSGAGRGRARSFLSLDVDGRVLRVDSLSKVVSAGMRVGFVTGPRTLIRQLELHTQVLIVQPRRDS